MQEIVRPSDDATASTAAPRSTAQRFGGYDGLRAIAALSVFVYHFSGIDGRPRAWGWGHYLTLANFGVPIFFVISGFLLYRPFVAARFDGRPMPSAREFLRRRVLRIVPGFWVAVTIVAFVLRHRQQGPKDLKWFVVNYGMLQSFVHTKAAPGVGVAWTIGTEMSFYLLLPVYAWLLARNRREPGRQLRAEIIGAALLIASSALFRIFVSSVEFPRALAWHQYQVNQWLPAHTDEFGAGMLLAALSVWFARHGNEPRVAAMRCFGGVCVAIAAGAYAFYIETLGDEEHTTAGLSGAQELLRHELFFVVAVALALPATFGPQAQGWVRRTLASRMMRPAALLSYGIYLYHPALIPRVYRAFGATLGWGSWYWADGPSVPVLVMLIASLAVVLAVATSSYRFVERPFLRRKAPVVRSGAR